MDGERALNFARAAQPGLILLAVDLLPTNGLSLCAPGLEQTREGEYNLCRRKGLAQQHAPTAVLRD